MGSVDMLKLSETFLNCSYKYLSGVGRVKALFCFLCT